jgi:SAM-dependent methyltransferase
MTRLEAERWFHDEQAAERAETFAGRPELLFTDDRYLDHEPWIRPALARLGDLRGKQVLDYGCGHGMASVVLARAGADVTAFDLSPGYVREACARAGANRVRVRTVVADAEHLPFDDASFDAVWGNAVLHHLDLHRASAELKRVLRPGGVAVFCEPWAGNPFLNLVRNRVWYPGKHRTPDERPLSAADLHPIRAAFPRLEVRGCQLFGMANRLVRRNLPGLERLDRLILTRLPALENWCRYVVLTLPVG